MLVLAQVWAKEDNTPILVPQVMSPSLRFWTKMFASCGSFEPPEPARSKALKLFNLLAGVGLLLLVGVVRWSLRTKPWTAPAGGGLSLKEQVLARLQRVKDPNHTPWSERIQRSVRQAAGLMHPRGKTIVLLLGLGIIGAAILLDGPESMESGATLPVLPAVPRESISRIEITSAQAPPRYTLSFWSNSVA